MGNRKAIGCCYAAALAALHARDPIAIDKTFNYLTLPSLTSLEQDLITRTTTTTTTKLVMTTTKKNEEGNNQNVEEEDDYDNIIIRNTVLAKAVIRRIVHRTLHSKFATSKKFTSQDIEDALKYHTLPQSLQNELYERYYINKKKKSSTKKNSIPEEEEKKKPPKTWYEVLEQLKFVSNNNKVKLWKLILENPMTSYQPMQCQKCGYVVPDCTGNDDEIGLVELQPTGTELEIRGGWFRGKPHGPKVFALQPCPSCGSDNKTTNIWYRSGHPQIILNPNRWGRLCGEQEDLRMMLANYLHIPLRLIIPLDWDHVWSEFTNVSSCPYYENTTTTNSSSSIDQQEQQQVIRWEVHDDNARNFALRLDEGIGSFTRIWAIHPNPQFCEDVTSEYLKYQSESEGGGRGRVDDRHNNTKNNVENRMDKYRRIIETTRTDSTGESTQAKTLNGFVLDRANFTSHDITNEMRKAVEDYHNNISWWEV